MSVFTSIERDELIEFLKQYSLGELVNFEGISAGIENTNYFVTTTHGQYVLTLFEQLSTKELPYFLELMAFLAEHNVSSAHPLPDKDGHYLRSLKGKPAALVHRLQGSNISEPNLAQIETLGSALGQLHTVGLEFGEHRENRRGPHWWKEAIMKVQPCLDEKDNQLLEDEFHFQTAYRHSNIPTGVTHADLFRDNALWEGDQLTGIIDFYYACDDVLLYDVAITVNDWCVITNEKLDERYTRKFLGAYNQQRAFTSQEQAVWPVMLRAAALRFWLSRLYDLHFPRSGEMTHILDPNVFKSVLQDRIQHHDQLQNLWVE